MIAHTSFPRVVAWLFAGLLFLVPATRVLAVDSRGTDFWLALTANYTGYTSTEVPELYITSQTATTGTVAVPGTGFSASFSVTPGTVTVVPLPVDAEVTGSDETVDRGIHVTALEPVTIVGLDRFQYTTDSYLGLPTSGLGTEYRILSYTNDAGLESVGGSQFAVVASEDGTTVTITPSVDTGTRAAGVSYSFPLNRGQVYQLRNTVAGDDLTGTLVVADRPVAVLAGQRCARIPPGYDACNHIVEQLPPVSAWGRQFATVPLATLTAGDTLRVLAATDGTEVSVNGTVVGSLNRGQYREWVATEPTYITTSHPVLVAQYGNSSEYNGYLDSDPFMMLVPSYEQWLRGYDVAVPAAGFAGNYANVIAPTEAIGTVTVDGAAIPATEFVAIGSSGLSGAKVMLTPGAAHRVESAFPLLVSSYGFDSFDGYGAAAGTDLAPVGLVSQLALAPASATNVVGSSHCVTATVADGDGDPLAAVRVDFSVAGAGTRTLHFHIPTDAAGAAELCFSSAEVGTDTIVARVGAMSATATKTWIAADAGNWRLKGEGWILLTGKRKLTFDVKAEQRTAVIRGAKLHWKDHVRNIGGRATAFDRVYRVGDTVYLEGRYRLSNGSTGTFAASAVDAGRRNDRFEITLSDGYHAEGVLGGGQVKVTDRQ